MQYNLVSPIFKQHLRRLAGVKAHVNGLATLNIHFIHYFKKQLNTSVPTLMQVGVYLQLVNTHITFAKITQYQGSQYICKKYIRRYLCGNLTFKLINMHAILTIFQGIHFQNFSFAKITQVQRAWELSLYVIYVKN